MKAIRTATICHNDDDYRDPEHRRVRLELLKVGPFYVWHCDGDECGLLAFRTVKSATEGAVAAWGAEVWDLRATWRRINHGLQTR